MVCALTPLKPSTMLGSQAGDSVLKQVAFRLGGVHVN